MSDALLTVREVADRLKVSPKIVREHIARGTLRAVNAGLGTRRCLWRVSAAELAKFELRQGARAFVPTRREKSGEVIAWV